MIPGFFPGTDMPTEGWWETLWPDPAGVLAKVGLMSGMRAIDLCCGTGWFTLPMAKVARRVVAIDIDWKCLHEARRRLSAENNCAFVAGDAYDIAKLSRRPADFIFHANAFHGVPDRPRLARAVKSALRTAGLFVIVNWHSQAKDHTIVSGQPRGPETQLRIGPEITRADVEGAGLREINLVELPPYHYASVFQCVSK